MRTQARSSELDPALQDRGGPPAPAPRSPGTGLTLPAALLVIGVGLLPWLSGCDGTGADDGDAVIPLGAPVLPDEIGLDVGERDLELLRLQVARDGAGLRRALEDPDAAVRVRAALALASVEDPAARAALEGRLSDPVAAVRRNAAFALGQIPAPDGGARLLAALRGEGASDVRLRIVEALGKQGGQPAVQGLLEWAPRPEGEEELAARSLALARLLLRRATDAEGSPDEWTERLVAELVEGLTSPLPGRRETSAWAFARLPEPDAWESRLEEIRAALDAMDGEDPAAAHLVTALARRQDAADLARYTERLLEARDWRLRTTAARAIGAREWVASDAVRDALWQAVESDPSDHVRVAAATALSGLLPPVRGPVVEAWVARDPADWRTRIPFLPSLVEAGRTEFVVDWVRRARATSPAAAMAGIETLHATGGPGVLDLLVELAGDPGPEVQAAAIRGLAGQWDRVGDADLERLVELFDQALRRGIPSPEDGDRERMAHLPAAAAAAAALGHPAVHGFGAMAILEEAYLQLDGVAAGEVRSASPGRGTGPDAVTLLREAVLLALGNLGDPGAIPLLETAREDSTPAIRRAAGEALEQLTGVRARGLNLPAVERGLDPERLRGLGREPRWILETDRGEIVVRLVPGQAPLTVQTVAELTEAGAYDDTAFHRVIGNFVAQGGDVSLRDGTGTPGFAIRSEWTQIPFVRGVVGMASAGKDTEGSQFFLTHASQPHLDGSFTAFGWVESGGDVMDRLMPGDRLLRARVVSTDGSPGPSPPPR